MPMERIDEFLRRYATQATIVLSAVVGVTGVMMFFHLAQKSVEGIHEWLGMAFVATALLHGLRHRRSIAMQFTQNRTRIMAGLSAVVVAVMLLAAGGEGGGNGMHQLAEKVQNAPIASVAPVLGLSHQQLVAHLRSQGLQVADENASLNDIAAANHANPHRLVEVAMDAAR